MNIINTIITEPIIGVELMAILFLCTYIVRDACFASSTIETPSKTNNSINNRVKNRIYNSNPRNLKKFKTV